MAGTPILSLGVNPDGFLDKYNCGICAGSVEKMNEGLNTLLENFETYSESAREYAVNRHDISKIIDEYKEIFRQYC